MMCGCNGGAGSGSRNDTIGYYVVLPGGDVLPAGVNPADPDAGEPPYAFYQEAHNQVVLNGGGTVRRLRKQPATT
ncbi:hypothetical protein AVV09_gp12 [Mycobacterium phage BrownCNA]|uniref:DUF7196 domain-containing protein n=11 Tax=Caudoviricetes TaxID=2731619 RepID=A0A7U0J733_9CAUD|nr:hypothetical protein AVV09_gp12 [Mycobacterium phage BrownCNA]YP_009614435.1 hypothetical protein FDI64_gp12 [Mycobacterium phage Zemanar]QFG08947.1 hypothetical protein SEA_MAGPIE_11 [Mycobacterium phage Magpie]QQV92905.1 hypothetical protein SEA_HYDRO_11 [Mycobacterium phage Hydro]AEJ95686.1 hypothetical protein ZEMANAR_12 [Mycobacterium phage Zemanar]AKY02725.1 hypothetical protein SEA_BROWNCNA_12 [Mycobacterium phage BrownCNA]